VQITEDSIGRVMAQWASERPQLDTSSLETIGRLQRIQHLLEPTFRDVLGSHGLDRGGCDVLASLRRVGKPYELTPTRLCNELVLTSGAITHRVDALERAGLVERRPDPEDRRGSIVALTASGKREIDEVMTAYMDAQRAVTALLSEKEKSTLGQLLSKLLVSIEGKLDANQ
jgi:DNA-binding MarR family transcriptional regulator